MPKPERGKFQKIITLENEFQPNQALIKKTLNFLQQHSAENANPARLESCTYEYTRAVGIFANCQDPQIGDMHINADLDHQQRMESIRELLKLARRMAELLEHPGIKTTALSAPQFAESVGGILRASSIVEKALDRNHARFLPSAEKKIGDPKRARYRLFVALAECWYACNPGCEVPARKREGGGPFANFTDGLLKLSPDTEQNVSTDELHRGILRIIKREAEASGPLFGVTKL